MNKRDTLNRKRCKTCNKWFVVGESVELLEDYCSDCETKGWLTDMRAKGCSVGDPDKIGDMPYIRSKTLTECPEVEIRGVRYRDVTSLMFEDGKITKTYPTRAEWEKINKQKEKRRIKAWSEESKKAQMNLKKQQAEKVEEKELTRNKQLEITETMLKEGYTQVDISNAINETVHVVRKLRYELELSGRCEKLKRGLYTDAEDAEIIKMRKYGYTMATIAEKMNRPYGGIKARIESLRKQGKLNEKNKGSYTSCEEEQIIQLRKENKTAKEIAEITNRSLSGIHTKISVLKKEGKI